MNDLIKRDLRAIDALVAEHIMGLEVLDATACTRDGDDPWLLKPPAFGKLPHYSSDIAAAWQVVEKLNLQGDIDYINVGIGPKLNKYETEIAHLPNEYSMAGRSILVEADTAPLATCLAALKAKGIEVPE